MAIEGAEEWKTQKKRGLMSDTEFHLDPSKMTDPAEKLLELDPNEAFEELVAQLPPNTDKEVVRQMKLILNKVIKQKQH